MQSIPTQSFTIAPEKILSIICRFCFDDLNFSIEESLLLSNYFNTTSDFWINFKNYSNDLIVSQDQYNLICIEIDQLSLVTSDNKRLELLTNLVNFYKKTHKFK